MAAYFFDSSALAKFYHPEVGTPFFGGAAYRRESLEILPKGLAVAALHPLPIIEHYNCAFGTQPDLKVSIFLGFALASRMHGTID